MNPARADKKGRAPMPLKKNEKTKELSLPSAAIDRAFREMN